MAITYNSQIHTYVLGQSSTPDSWLISTWAAGQSSLVNWSAANVQRAADGSINMLLNRAPAGSSRPMNGSEVQSNEVATTGTWAWVAQAPKMKDGTVFGMFTYRADHKNQPWIEFDFEFVGKDTTKVQLNIHMEDAQGRHISLDQARGGPVIVDLGFDASLAKHTYEVTVTHTGATFYIDGKVVGQFGPKDMPGGVWQIGPQKSFVDLWAVDPAQHSWAGVWVDDGTTLKGNFGGFDIRPNEYGSQFASNTDTTQTPLPPAPPPPASASLEGDGGNNALTGTAADETLNGRAGNDTLRGGGGNDRFFGGEGDDWLFSGSGNDSLDGGAGIDWLAFANSVGATVDLRIATAQATGHGNDIVTGIENISGTAAADRFSGDDLANRLQGLGGNDRLSGNGGSDTLEGGAGADTLDGGTGNDRVLGGDGNDTLILDAGNDTLNGEAGNDTLLVTGTTGATIDLRLTTAQSTGYGSDLILGFENATGGAGNDRFTATTGVNLLIGNGGADVLSGTAGADTLVGGAGRDVLYGGRDLDRDTFVFNALTESAVGSARDRIFDFRSGTDVIDLRQIDSNTVTAGDQAFAFGGSRATANGVWFTAASGSVIVSVDSNGDARADMEIFVNGISSLTAGDFLL